MRIDNGICRGKTACNITDLARLACACLVAFAACESLEGERLLVPGAHLSLFVPANWEAAAKNGADDGSFLELGPRSVRTVKVKVLVDPKRGQSLDDMVQGAMREAAQLDKKAGIDIVDVTQIPIKRGHLHGMRIVHQLRIVQSKGKPPLELTQISDLLPIDGLSVALLALGPKPDVDTVSAELDRILSSVKGMTPEPEVPRTYPPDAVTSASQRATQQLVRGH